MKTRTLSTRIDDDTYDWLWKKAKDSTISRVICDILKRVKEGEKKK